MKGRVLTEIWMCNIMLNYEYVYLTFFLERQYGIKIVK